METNYNKKDIILNAKQVSEFLHIPLRTIHHLSKQGRIKAVKIGKHWRYLKSDIEKYFSFNVDLSKEPAKIPDNHIECRDYQRINCSLPCFFKVFIPDEKEISSTSRILNISQCGAFIKNNEENNIFCKIKADDPIKLLFKLDQGNEKNYFMNTQGRVIRIDNRGIGIKFRNISEYVKNRIANYVG